MQIVAAPMRGMTPKRLPVRGYGRGGIGLSPGFRSLRRADLDEVRELQLAAGEIFRPEVDLLAVLPLQKEASDRAFADLQGVRIGRILALELDAADGADPVRRFERGD